MRFVVMRNPERTKKIVTPCCPIDASEWRYGPAKWSKRTIAIAMPRQPSSVGMRFVEHSDCDAFEPLRAVNGTLIVLLINAESQLMKISY